MYNLQISFKDREYKLKLYRFVSYSFVTTSTVIPIDDIIRPNFALGRRVVI